MPKPAIEFTPATPSNFTAEVTTILSALTLSRDPVTGDETVIQERVPGSAWGDPRLSHDYWEEVYIISGRMYDVTLQQWFSAGSYCCRPPGMLHGPYRADEQEGVKELCWIRYPRQNENRA